MLRRSVRHRYRAIGGYRGRDEAYYNPNTPTCIAGFFSPRIGSFTGRNVMVIDSNAWDQRLAAV
ncbi:MAG: hypothetical protein BRD24_06465 [Halobacteriales archaeon SW_9_67_24]|nr:MAG: hypothetical protein BRD24_06465 [Halobacteriales archaeon SW_9_67_24]